jgi:uncharacterized protein YjiS (DUF1127 family)
VTMVLFRGLPDESASSNWTAAAEPCLRARGPHRPLVLEWVREAWGRRRSRTYLSQLDDRMLKDIGITRAEADWEANKPFWLP